MQYISTFLLSSLLAISLHAAEDKVSDSSQATQSEFSYIQPIAVEEAPVSKVKKVILDDDKDGVPNEKDRCPTTPKGDKVDITGCTILNDADKDGVPDKDDKCPETLLGTKVDYRGCEVDSDDDGVVDSKDQCPNTSKDFVADGYGCPQTATLKVNFATNKYDVDDKLINQLQTFALFLKENPGYQVILYGYTDSIGDDAANKLLSQNRANAVKEALTRYGISKMKLTAIGRGKENPVASNKTKEGRAKNRRIEVELIK